MQTLWQDIRYGVRILFKNPGFSLIAVITLALGIGANTAIFTLINAALFKPLPVAEPDRLAFVFNGNRERPYSSSSYPDYLDYRNQNQVFSGLICYGSISVSMGGAERADLINGLIVTGNYFDVLGVRAALGRTFLPEEDQTPGAHPVAVISHTLWQDRFGGQSSVIGREVPLNGQSFTIIGVTPPGFHGAQVLETNDIYIPMMMQALVRPPRAGFSGGMNPDLLSRRGTRWLAIIGRLKPDYTIEQAQAEVSTLAAQLDRAYPESNRNVLATLFPVSEIDPIAYPQLVSVATLLMAVVGIVLLIACANVANLLLARATARRKEIAVRLALGAGRGRLVRQLLTESSIIALMGGAAGLLLASWATEIFKTAPPIEGMFAFTLDYSLDSRVLAFTLLLSILTGVIFGLAPALQSLRSDLVPALKDEAFRPDRNSRFNLRNTLVVAQVALSLVLLIGAGLFLRSFRHAQGITPGFDVDRLLTATLNINLLRYTKNQGQEFYRRVTERVQSLPGVESVSLARTVPLSGIGRTNILFIEGQAAPDNPSLDGGQMAGDGNPQTVKVNVVGLNYFKTMGIALLRGRDFTAQDRDDSPGVVIVNESFVNRYLPDQEPIGRRLSQSGAQGPWLEIMGVVRDSKYRSLSESPTPFIYVPLAQNHETGMTLHVRAAGEPSLLAAAVRNEIQALDKNLPVTGLQPMATMLSDSLFASRMGALLLGVFGLLALLLASVGLYGVISYSVSRRSREIGIRMALGARQRDVVGLVVGQGMKLSLLGVGIGLVMSLGLTRLLSSLLVGISASDPATFTLISLLLVGISLLACFVPARRAARVDPMTSLRYE